MIQNPWGRTRGKWGERGTLHCQCAGTVEAGFSAGPSEGGRLCSYHGGVWVASRWESPVAGGPRPGRGGDQPDPSRCLREGDSGLERPQRWSLTPGKQVWDAGNLEPLRMGCSP